MKNARYTLMGIRIYDERTRCFGKLGETHRLMDWLRIALEKDEDFLNDFFANDKEAVDYLQENCRMRLVEEVK